MANSNNSPTAPPPADYPPQSGHRPRREPYVAWPGTTMPVLTESPSGNVMVLDAPLFVAITPQRSQVGEDTTGTVIRVPPGVWIPGETPLREQRALLVATYCAPLHPPARVDRWVTLLLEEDAGL